MPKILATKRAGEIMVSLDKYPQVRHDATLRDAVTVMVESSIDIGDKRSLPRALLVTNNKGEIIGIVRRRDLFRGLEPKFLHTMPMSHRRQLFDIQLDPNLIDLSSGRVAKAIREQSKHPVSDVMSPITETVDFEDHLAKIIYLMVHKNRALIPVLKNRKVIGVVRTVDAFNEIHHLLEEES